jgi:hypothetical protein
MTSVPTARVSFAGFRGLFVARHVSDGMTEWLRSMPERVAAPGAEVLHHGRNRIVRLPFPLEPAWAGVCVKRFAEPAPWQGMVYARTGGKAAKAFRNAVYLMSHDAGVPEPVGFLERCEGGRLVESYLLAAHLAGWSDFRREAERLAEGDAADWAALAHVVGSEVRRMHEAGFVHFDLGGQNILVERRGPREWGRPAFIDLNRGRVRAPVSARLRARDLSRLRLGLRPAEWGALLRVYWAGEPEPAGFAWWERVARWRFELHVRSHRWRHPLRAWKRRREGAERGLDSPPGG